MNLKKLTAELVEGIKDLGFDESPKPIQTASIPVIKSGADLFMISPKQTGKTNALLIGVIQQLKEEFEDAPRAIIMAPTKEQVFKLEEQFEKLAFRTSLRVFSVFERGDMKYQKDMIFDGIDVLIGTPIRITELLKKNGIPLSNVKMIIMDDAHELRIDKYTHIYGVTDKAPKAQIIIAAQNWNKNFERLSAEVMKNPRVVREG